jgi:hypothetical protein
MKLRGLKAAALISLLVVSIGVQGYLLYRVAQISGSAQTREQAMRAPGQTSPARPVNTVAPGSGLTEFDGIVREVGANAVTIKVHTSDVAIAVPDSTEVLLEGKPKDPQTIAAGYAAYNGWLRVLLADPVRNQRAISELLPPMPFQTSPMILSKLKKEDFLVVLALRNADGSWRAARIVKAPPMPLALKKKWSG